MIEIAMSTVACPELTIQHAIELAERTGFDGIEFRTGGVRATRLACDPFLTDEAKTRGELESEGIKALCLATATTFDQPIDPPVLGRLRDNEPMIREAKRSIDLAAQLECPFVRVFGFQKTERESYKSVLKRVAGRLHYACDHCRNTGTYLAIENGGTFSSAEQLAELVDKVDSPFIRASYDVAIGADAGDEPAQAIAALGSRLGLIRVRDNDENGPVMLGTGVRPGEAFVRTFAEAGFDGSIVYEWERLWFEGLRPADEVLPEAVRKLCDWAGLTAGAIKERQAVA